jgi:hypothetical protein
VSSFAVFSNSCDLISLWFKYSPQHPALKHSQRHFKGGKILRIISLEYEPSLHVQNHVIVDRMASDTTLRKVVPKECIARRRPWKSEGTYEVCAGLIPSFLM